MSDISLTQSASGSLTQGLSGDVLAGSAKLSQSQVINNAQDNVLESAAAQDDTVDNLQDTVEQLAGVIRQSIQGGVEKKEVQKEDPAHRVQKTKAAGKKSAQSIAKVSKDADKLQKSSGGELSSVKLMLVYTALKNKGNGQEALAEAQKQFKEPSLVAEAMRFLEEETTGDVQKSVAEVRSQFESEHKREIDYGQVMSERARDLASASGAGESAGEIKKALEEIMNGDSNAGVLDLFKKLNTSYGSYRKSLQEIHHSLHVLGASLKAANAERPVVQAAIKGIRGSQAIIGVFHGSIIAHKRIAKECAHSPAA